MQGMNGIFENWEKEVAEKAKLPHWGSFLSQSFDRVNRY